MHLEGSSGLRFRNEDELKWVQIIVAPGRGFSGPARRPGLQPRGEVPQEWRFVAKPKAMNAIAILPDLQNHFDDIIDVTLRVSAAGCGEADEVHFLPPRRTSACRSASWNRRDSRPARPSCAVTVLLRIRGVRLG